MVAETFGIYVAKFFHNNYETRLVVQAFSHQWCWLLATRFIPTTFNMTACLLACEGRRLKWATMQSSITEITLTWHGCIWIKIWRIVSTLWISNFTTIVFLLTPLLETFLIIVVLLWFESNPYLTESSTCTSKIRPKTCPGSEKYIGSPSPILIR